MGIVLFQAILIAGVFNPAPHTGGDNAGYISLAHSLQDRGAYLELWDPGEVPHTKYPPVFPLILAAVMALGVKGWVGLKTVPFVSTLLAGFFCFLWARERRGLALAAAVAGLFAISDGVLDYSRWILSDPIFLALTFGGLWALERTRERDGERGGSEGRVPWVILASVLVLLTYFTRSAGLPLVAATALWFGLRRRWRAVGVFLAGFLVPAVAWWVRGRAPGGSGYVAEFWLVDPYRPELGRVGLGGLAQRVAENLLAYVTRIIPEGVVGVESPLLPMIGLALALVALVGWVLTARRDPSAAELFFPLYFGLILLWPPVWSGDRFALPLLPLLFFYGGVTLTWGLRGIPRRGRVAICAAAVLVLLIPAFSSWNREARQARECARIVRGNDSFACYSTAVQEYAAMAAWSAENLPGDAVVVTRKPRIFYLLSGLKTQSVPLTAQWEGFRDSTLEAGAGYVTLDRWGALTSRYLIPVLQERPSAFCWITAIGVSGQEGTQLLGILDDAVGAGGAAEPGLALCPAEMIRAVPREIPDPPPGSIPLLLGYGGR
jgi:hypothetical protein